MENLSKKRENLANNSIRSNKIETTLTMKNFCTIKRFKKLTNRKCHNKYEI